MDWGDAATLAVGVGAALFGSNLLSTAVMAWYSNRGRRNKLRMLERYQEQMIAQAQAEAEDDE